MKLATRFARDTSAVSAVEFAVILPVMIMLLLGSFDITRAIQVRGKLALLSRTISDFVSQQNEVTQTQLGNIVLASQSVLYPYPDDSSILTVEIQSIDQKPDGTYRIDWSYPPANSTDRTTPLTPPGKSIVQATVHYTHRLTFGSYFLKSLGFDTLNMESTTSMAPRSGTPVLAKSF